MTDQPKSEPTANDPTKAGAPAKPTPAEAAAASKAADAVPKSRKISLAEQVFIVVLVVLVGLVWGVSGSFSSLGVTSREVVAGISDNEIIQRETVMEKLQRALPYETVVPRDFFHMEPEQRQQYVGRMVKIARAAEQDGLMPGGAALERLTTTFLAKVAPEFDQTTGKQIPPKPGARTNGDVLHDLVGGPNAITLDDLHQFLAESTAFNAYFERHETVPAVSIAVGHYLVGSYQDAVIVDRAVLTGDNLVVEIKPDDPEIQVDYEKLRSTRFRSPATIALTIAYADLAALKAAAPKPDDAAIQAYYTEHKADFPKPAASATAAKPDAPTEYLTVAQAHDAIVDKLTSAAALDQARAETTALDAAVEEKSLDQGDLAAFTASATAAGLLVKNNLVVSASDDNTLALGSLGTLTDSVGVFGHDRDPGYISRPVQADQNGTWMLLRLGTKTEAGFQPLDAVRPEVIKHLQGQRVWKKLLDQAEIARAQAEKLGAGGLKKWAASPDGAAWKAIVTTKDMHPTDLLYPPPQDRLQAPGDPRLAASLAMPDHAVMLVNDDSATGDIPQVFLIQATAYKAEVLKPEEEKQFGPQLAHEWRGHLLSYRAAINESDVRKLIEGK